MAKLIFITGPSGSGKSTTAAELASLWPSLCALIDFDHIRTFIKSGYAEPSVEWNEAAQKQWDIAMRVIVAMAKTYLSNDVYVVLPVFATPHDLPSWIKLFEGLDYKCFALMPSLETVIERNNSRMGAEKLKESDIKQNYEWSKWADVREMQILDNSHKTIRQIVEEIIELAS